MSKQARKTKTDEIPLIGKALREVEGALAQLQEISGKLSAFLGGYRTAAGVPEGWTFNAKTRAFVPPEKKEKKE